MSRARCSVIVLATVVSILLAPTSSFAQTERTCVYPKESFTSPYAPVIIRVDYDTKRLTVEPKTSTIYVNPENPKRPTQVLWLVECLNKMHYSPADKRSGRVSDCLAPGDELVIRPKVGCSKELFGDELRIEREHTAITSGTPHPDVVEELFLRDTHSETLCDGRSRAKVEQEMGMKLGGGKDMTWAYDVVILRNGEVVMEVDPEIWIEKEGGG